MGLPAGAAWGLTPREWYRALVAWRDAQQAAQNDTIRGAWLTAVFTRTKKLPELEKVLIGPAKPAAQSVASMRGVLHMLSGIYGGRVTRGPAKKAARRVTRGPAKKAARRG